MVICAVCVKVRAVATVSAADVPDLFFGNAFCRCRNPLQVPHVLPEIRKECHVVLYGGVAIIRICSNSRVREIQPKVVMAYVQVPLSRYLLRANIVVLCGGLVIGHLGASLVPPLTETRIAICINLERISVILSVFVVLVQVVDEQLGDVLPLLPRWIERVAAKFGP